MSVSEERRWTPPCPPAGSAEAVREKRAVALASVLAACVLTGIKIVVGLSTHSLGILSEAAHSGLDLAAACVTWFAVRASAKPADREHPYGHGKIENLSALLETVLLLGTCVWIIWEAMERLFVKSVAVDASLWAFLTVTISILIDYSRSRALMRVARKYSSQALEADALHFSTDIWSSLIVLIGLLLVRFAALAGAPWLLRADAVAALGVAAIVAWISVRLGKRAVNDLIDAVPPALRQEVERAARVPGIYDAPRIRLRRSGPEFFADLTLCVDRGTSLERAHDIATEAERAVQAVLPGADVIVHVDPVRGGEEGLLETARRVAARYGMGAHGLHIHDHSGRTTAELHLEIDDALTVAEAHDLATAFESALREAVPWITEVVTHPEPMSDSSTTSRADPAEEAAVARALERLRGELGIRRRPGKLRLRRDGRTLTLSFSIEVEGEAGISQAHALTQEIERRLRKLVPDLGRIVIHVEPPGG